MKAPHIKRILFDDGSFKASFLTRDNTLRLEGTSKPGTKIIIFDKGEKLGIAKTNKKGKWSLDTAVLSDGAHVFKAKAKKGKDASDFSKKVTGAIDTVLPLSPSLDLTAPSDTGSSSTDKVTSDTTPTVSGGAEAGSTVRLFAGGVEIGKAVANAGGAWTITPTAALGLGVHSLMATATDAAGNVSAASTIGVSIVNGEPIAIGDIFEATEDTQVVFSALQILGNDTDSDTAGSGLRIASVTNGSGGAAVLNPNGTVTFSPSANFDGTANFTYQVTDGTSVSAPATVSVNVAPTDVITASIVGTGFDTPVFASSAPGDGGRLYVVSKTPGQIHILDPVTGQRSLFLDIPDSELGTNTEEGLLGLAFHPGYASNGRFFIHLVNAAGDIEIREYVRSAIDPHLAEPLPVRQILAVTHSGSNTHYGGAMAFSPADGLLYIALGDAGSGSVLSHNAQNLDVLLGKILRIDVNGDDFVSPTQNYAIPHDNPFVGVSGADEIWAYGLRNPWRIAFDENGDLYIADVGQRLREEIDFLAAGGPGGADFGWDLAEGSLGSLPIGSVLPIFEYAHDLGRSVTGGEVYRGTDPDFNGAYFFADFISGRIWTFKDGVTVERTAQIVTDGPPIDQIVSFGLDGAGELYVVSLSGNIYHLAVESSPEMLVI